MKENKKNEREEYHNNIHDTLVTGFLAFTLGGCMVFLLLTMLVTAAKGFFNAF